jgi:hypothetical protein
VLASHSFFASATFPVFAPPLAAAAAAGPGTHLGRLFCQHMLLTRDLVRGPIRGLVVPAAVLDDVTPGAGRGVV